MEALEFHQTPHQRSVHELPHTRNALRSLQNSLLCRKCCQHCKELFTLGQCEHRFCRSCAEETLGETCPVCDMPSHATQAHVDKQLSNIASLCMQMSDLLEGRSSCIVVSKTCTGQISGQNEESDSEAEKREEAAADAGHCRSKRNTKTAKTRKGLAQSYVKDCDERGFGFPSPVMNKVSGKGTSVNASKKQDNCFTSIDKAKRKKRSESLPSNLAEKLNSKPSPGPKRQGRKSEQLVGMGDATSSPRTSPAGWKSVKGNQNSASKDKGKNKTYLMKRNAKGETPLQVATIKADVETVKNLLEAGANPNVRDNAGWTPLHEAVNHGNATIAQLLIKHGASVNAPGLDNDTPLHDAISNYRLDCVKLLVTSGADTLARNVHGRTAFDLAQNDEMREVLLSASSSSATCDKSVVVKEDDNSQPICLLGTALSRDQQAMLHKAAKMLHAKTVEEFSHEVTHLVTGVNAEGMCPRTLKYLNVILSGKWVLSTEWLSACLEYSERVPEEGFEIAGCSTNPSTMAPYKARQNRLQQLPGLFDGCQVYFHGKFNYPTPSREDLAGLVKQGGGVLLTREPRLHNLDDYPYTIPFHASQSSSLADCAIFVIYDDSCPNPPHVEAQRMSCLPVSWLMDSIATFALLDKSFYLKN